MHMSTDQDIITPFFALPLYGATLLGCFLLIMHPLRFFIYTILCSIWGLVHIIDGGSVLGAMLYALGVFFAWKQGFFTAHAKLKQVLAAALVLAALCSQVRYGGGKVMDSLIDLAGLAAIGSIAVFLARGELSRPPRSAARSLPFEKRLVLPLGTFKPCDAAIARSILAGAKYTSAANEQGIALSTVKRRAKALFVYTGAADAQTFRAAYKDWTVELEQAAAPPVPVVKGHSRQ
jgi:hypothetical protein